MTSQSDEAAAKVKKAFNAYLKSTNPGASNKASSYVRALDLLGEMLHAAPYGFEDCRDLWRVESLHRLQELHVRAAEEKGKGEASAWNVEGIAPSYLRDGFCSAALRNYQEFLVEYRHEQDMLAVFEGHRGDADELPGKRSEACELHRRQGIHVRDEAARAQRMTVRCVDAGDASRPGLDAVDLAFQPDFAAGVGSNALDQSADELLVVSTRIEGAAAVRRHQRRVQQE